jgi:hypothetical protein
MCALHLPEATRFDQVLKTFGKRMPVQKWCWSNPGIMVQLMQQSQLEKSASLYIFQHVSTNTKKE